MNEQKKRELESVFNYFALSVLGINPSADKEEIGKVMEERRYAMGRSEDNTQVFFGRRSESGEEAEAIFCSIDLEAVMKDQLQHSKPFQWAKKLKGRPINNLLVDCDDLAKDNCFVVYCDSEENEVHIEGYLGDTEEFEYVTVLIDGASAYIGSIINGRFQEQPEGAFKVPVSKILEDLGVQHNAMGDIFVGEDYDIDYAGPLDHAGFYYKYGKAELRAFVIQLPAKPKSQK